jgi:hypothetical protein
MKLTLKMIIRQKIIGEWSIFIGEPLACRNKGGIDNEKVAYCLLLWLVENTYKYPETEIRYPESSIQYQMRDCGLHA